MTTLLIISILLVTLYVGVAIWKERELPESISAMVYLLPEGGAQWLWSLWMVVTAIITFAPVISILDRQGLGFLGFLSMVLLAFVAVWPLYDKEHTVWHNVFGIAAGVLSQVCVRFICPWWLWLWILFIAYEWYSRKYVHVYPNGITGKSVFIAEVICFTTIICTIFTNF